MSAKIVPLLNQIADYYNGFAEDQGLELAVTWNQTGMTWNQTVV